MNNNKRNILLAVILTFIMTVSLFSFVSCGLVNVTFNNNANSTSIDGKLAEINSFIDEYAIMPFDKETALSNAIFFYVASLEDPYCSYMDADEYAAYLEELSGSFTGIGVNVITTSEILENGLLIYRVIGNSPAELAGLKNGDVIVEANGVSFIDYPYEDAVDIMLDELGTTINLVVDRNGERLEFNIVRQNFTKRLVDYEIIENLGYITVYQFEAAAYDQFKEALNALEKAGVKGYIFDMRNNPGGELNTVKNMVDLLVPKDEIVVLQYKDYESSLYASDNDFIDKPCVVLINGESASAAELFSSALRDIRGSKLIGEQSFGKGVGQTTFSLNDGSALKFTTFRYVTKSRYNYDGIGLEPDYIVELPLEDTIYYYCMSRSDDTQLAKAIQVLGEEVEK
ncbi:MAG: S41 family peptidase [Ruminococcaceae bacterium]|nr:S41 family peptidase [Oscillospiraceae bacterium]